MYTHFCEAGGFTVASFKQTCVGCTRLAHQCEHICEACFRSVCVHCADDHRTQAGVHHPDTLKLPGTAETMKFIVATKIKHKEWTKQAFTPTLHAGVPGTYTELRKIRVVGLNSKSGLKETVEMDCATEPQFALKGILLSRPEWITSETWTQMPVGEPLPEFHYSVDNPEVRIVGNLLLPEDYIVDRKEWRSNMWRKMMLVTVLPAGIRLIEFLAGSRLGRPTSSKSKEGANKDNEEPNAENCGDAVVEEHERHALNPTPWGDAIHGTPESRQGAFLHAMLGDRICS